MNAETRATPRVVACPTCGRPWEPDTGGSGRLGADRLRSSGDGAAGEDVGEVSVGALQNSNKARAAEVVPLPKNEKPDAWGGITDEMVAVGCSIYWDRNDYFDSPSEIVKAIYVAMRRLDDRP